MRDDKDVSVRECQLMMTLTRWFHQIKISAGHEFIVSTDTKYYNICDDKVMFVDYVCHFPDSGSIYAESFVKGKPPQGYRAGKADLCR